MPLDGVRAWVAEVERKLGKRTRVFLALCVISIGIAGAAVYLAIDARESSVSESDVQELQRELEARIDEGMATTPGLGAPEAEPAPVPESTTPGAKGQSGKGQSGNERGGASQDGDAKAPETGAELEDLLEQAREQAE